MALPRLRPSTRAAWRRWLERHHATSSGTWVVFAKKHTKLPSLSYEDAVQEALCFGWIDSLVKSIDDRFHMQMFTPRKPKSAWSATNKARVSRLTRAGLMAAAGLAAIAAAKKAGTWATRAAIDSPMAAKELQTALNANPAARQHWVGYSESARRMFLSRIEDAKRPDTREKRIQETVDLVSHGVSMTVLRQAAMSGTFRALLDSLRLTTSASSGGRPSAAPGPRPPRAQAGQHRGRTT